MLVDCLKAWLADATSDNPSYDVTVYGLCSSGYFESTEDRDALSDALHSLGYCRYFPFGMDEYDADSEAGTHHINPDRLAWVRQYIKDHDNV